MRNFNRAACVLAMIAVTLSATKPASTTMSSTSTNLGILPFQYKF